LISVTLEIAKAFYVTPTATRNCKMKNKKLKLTFLRFALNALLRNLL